MDIGYKQCPGLDKKHGFLINIQQKLTKSQEDLPQTEKIRANTNQNNVKERRARPSLQLYCIPAKRRGQPEERPNLFFEEESDIRRPEEVEETSQKPRLKSQIGLNTLNLKKEPKQTDLRKVIQSIRKSKAKTTAAVVSLECESSPIIDALSDVHIKPEQNDTDSTSALTGSISAYKKDDFHTVENEITEKLLNMRLDDEESNQSTTTTLTGASLRDKPLAVQMETKSIKLKMVINTGKLVEEGLNQSESDTILKTADRFFEHIVAERLLLSRSLPYKNGETVDSRKPSISDHGKSSTGDLGKPSTSDLGKSSTGDLGKPSTGDLGKPSTSDLVKPSTGDLGKPSTGDLVKPSTGDLAEQTLIKLLLRAKPEERNASNASSHKLTVGDSCLVADTIIDPCSVADESLNRAAMAIVTNSLNSEISSFRMRRVAMVIMQKEKALTKSSPQTRFVRSLLLACQREASEPLSCQNPLISFVSLLYCCDIVRQSVSEAWAELLLNLFTMYLYNMTTLMEAEKLFSLLQKTGGQLERDLPAAMTELCQAVKILFLSEKMDDKIKDILYDIIEGKAGGWKKAG